MLTMLCGCAKDKASNGNEIAFTLTVTHSDKSQKEFEITTTETNRLSKKTSFRVRNRSTGCLSPQWTAKQLITARTKDGGASQKTASRHLRE